MRKTEITIMGHLITKQGMQADPTKITAIRDMPLPTDVCGVKQFCGMIQYLARFMPNIRASERLDQERRCLELEP